MKLLQQIWSGLIIILFTGFVISTVFDTSQTEIIQSAARAGSVQMPVTSYLN